MRIFIDIAKRLVEAKIITLDPFPYSVLSAPVKIWETPTHKEVVTLLQYRSLRGIMTQDRYFLWDSRQDHLHGDVRRLLVDNGYLTDTAPSVHVVLTNEGRDFGEFGYWIGDGFHLNGIAIMTEDGEDGPYMNWSSMDKLFGRKVDGPI